MGLRAEQAQREEFKLSGGTFCGDFGEIGATAPDGTHEHPPIELRPSRRARERMWEPLHMYVPAPQLPVEIMLAGRFSVRRGHNLASTVRGTRQRNFQIGLPGSPAVFGEGLFQVMCRRRKTRPRYAHHNCSPVVGFTIKKFTATVLELAEHRRRLQNPVRAIHETYIPLVGFRVIEHQPHVLEMSVWSVGFDLFNLPTAVPDFLYHLRAFQGHPGFGSRERLYQALDVDLPCPQIKVEIVLPVANGGTGRGFSGERRNGQQAKDAGDGAQVWCTNYRSSERCVGASGSRSGLRIKAGIARTPSRQCLR
jgi:hypothetical protein